MKLTIGSGTAVKVEDGYVTVNGSTVELIELGPKRPSLDKHLQVRDATLVLAYCLRPGETVRRTPEGDYDVQF